MALAMTQEQVYTVDEVAAILRVTPRTIRRIIARGEIEAFLVGDTYRVRHSVLDEFMRRRPKKREDQQP